MGSKARIAKHIVPILQDCIDRNNITTYIEPFVGRANVIDKIKCKWRMGNDINRYLIALLRRARNQAPLLESVTREEYNKARLAYKSGDIFMYDDWEIGNIGFLASYNGKWFDGGFAQAGYEKTKNGSRYRDYYREAKNNLEKQRKNLQGIHFTCKDYSRIDSDSAVIYCDPPYANTTQFANSKSFDYEQFWDWVRERSKNNYVFVSELNAPPDFISIWEQSVSRSIKATDKSRATEKLFVYKYGLLGEKYETIRN